MSLSFEESYTLPDFRNGVYKIRSYLRKKKIIYIDASDMVYGGLIDVRNNTIRNLLLIKFPVFSVPGEVTSAEVKVGN